MRLADLHPRWVGAGGDGVYQLTGRPCPACPQDQIDSKCRVCLGRGQEYAKAILRSGVGISFLCPCETCAAQRVGDDDSDFHLRLFVGFSNPIDGGAPIDPRTKAQWYRGGETFETLTLTPSILSTKEHGGCGWHGFVTAGEVTSV